MKRKIYVFDLDNTLCITQYVDGKPQYYSSVPIKDRIIKVNKLFDDNNIIIIETARGTMSGNDWFYFTLNQLKDWGLKFDHLRTNTKYVADYYIDDKAINDNEFFNK